MLTDFFLRPNKKQESFLFILERDSSQQALKLS